MDSTAGCSVRLGEGKAQKILNKGTHRCDTRSDCSAGSSGRARANSCPSTYLKIIMKRIAFSFLFALSQLGPSTYVQAQELTAPTVAPAAVTLRGPTELSLRKAGSSTRDLRTLPQTAPSKFNRARPADPTVTPAELPGSPALTGATAGNAMSVATAAAPGPSISFEGLDYASWGAGRPSDNNGDAGPTYYVEVVNSSIGIFRKSDGVRLVGVTFNTFMSQGLFGNLCDTNNFGDPVVLYDSFEDRWIITDFAFVLDASGNVTSPPGAIQCFAASKTGDPVSGGWNFYSMPVTDALNDYSKFGIWPDGLYMSANMFGFASGASYISPRVWALNKAQMYAGAPNIQIVSFDAPSGEFSLLPANARLQAGAPPTGSPNYFSVVWQYTNALSIYKFHVDWDRVSLSTFTGPFISLAPASWIGAPATVPSQGGNSNDTLGTRLMMQNQYTNIGGVESVWASQTVRNPTTVNVAAVRYYQTDVTGGTVAANLTQAATHAPDVTNRYMPSLAVNRRGDMAVGYSASSATLFPAIRYAGRLATDLVNTLPQTETSLIEGSGSQNTTTRWGDYTAMTLDPDGCSFWYVNQYFTVVGNNWQTRIGSFAFPGCTPVGNGTLQGTVTAATGGAAVAGATVTLGSRQTTTDSNGVYTFSALPSGAYNGVNVLASAAGFSTGSATGIAIVDSATTTQNFSLTSAALSACLVDTSLADFQLGTTTATDLNASPGDVTLLDAPKIDQQNLTIGTSGVGITISTWGGQTFTPATTGVLTRADINLFCSGCTGTTPTLMVSLRATAAGLPTGADIATAIITGFGSGASGYYTATFATPPTLTAGTQYALVVRPTANPSPGTYALTRSGTSTLGSSPYAGGTRVSGATSGTVWSIPLTGGVNTDAGFKIYVKTGFAATGSFASSIKDTHPVAGGTANWSTIAWAATTPASTEVKFQIAASNASTGPFGFVGPDGTAATYFTSSGASLSQFNGKRFLQYKAFLGSSDSTITPTVNDVTACYVVVVAPVITQDPQNTTVNSGSAASFTVAANGIPTPTVQWQVSADSGANFTDMAAETATTLTLSSVPIGLNGNQYRAVFTNGGGTATSVAATLTVQSAPIITTDPVSQTLAVGATATLTAAASGLPAPTVQWYVSGDNGVTFSLLPGATSPTLSFTVAPTHNNKLFRATFTNIVDSTTSSAAVLSVTAGAVLNIDNSDPGTVYDAGTDGVLLLRYLLGLRGAALIAGARGTGASLRDAAAIESHLETNSPLFDVDNDGKTLALTDGLMILRRLLNPTASATDAAATAAITAGLKNSTRSDENVVRAIDSLKP